MLHHQTPALSILIDLPACPQIKACSGRDAIQNKPLLRITSVWKLSLDVIPKPDGVKWFTAAVDE